MPSSSSWFAVCRSHDPTLLHLSWQPLLSISGRPTHYVLCDYFYQACDAEGVQYLEDRIRHEVFGVPSGIFEDMILPSSWYSQCGYIPLTDRYGIYLFNVRRRVKASNL
jgi:hypothetical protein